MRLHFLSIFCRTLLAGITGFIIGADRVHGEDFGNALAFDGINQYVSVPNFGAVAPTTEVTVEFWALADVQAQQAAFMLQPDQGSNRFNGHINYHNGNTYWDFGDINGGGRLQIPNPPNTLGVWTHYALVASQTGTFMRMYVNGVASASGTTMNNFETGTYELRIGGNTGFHFHGKLDEFRVWNRARTEAEIRNSRSSPLTGSEAGLQLYYRFNEDGGNVALNSATATGPAYNGTLVNSPARVASVPLLGIELSPGGDAVNTVSPTTFGWSFSVAGAVSVSSLGLLDLDFDGIGFKNPHAIGLWTNDGTLLATTTLAAGVGAPAVPSQRGAASWRFASITPVVLPPGIYRIGAAFKINDGDAIAASAPRVPTPGISYLGSWGTEAPGLNFPAESEGDFTYFGANFQFTGVSIQASWDANGSTAPNPADGSGSWNTSSANWWNGLAHTPWVQGGTAIFGAGTGAAGAVSVDSPVTVQTVTFNAAQSGTYTITGPQPITLGSATTALITHADAEITTALTGAGAGLTKSGTGVLTLAGANTYTGSTTISAGTLILPQSPAPGNIVLGDAGTGNANISMQASTTVNNPITISAQGTGIASLGSTATGTAAFEGAINLQRDLTLSGGNPDSYPPEPGKAKTQFNGTITGPSGVNVAGPGWVQFNGNGARTYSGPTTVLSGAKVSLCTANSLPATPLIIQTGGIVRLEGISLTLAGLSGGGVLTGNATYGPSTVTLGAGNGDFDFSGQINAPINIIKTGTGTQTFSGQNATRGHTTINQGTLAVTSAALDDAGVVTIAAGGKLHLSHDQEDVVNALIVAGDSRPSGLYGAPGSANPNDTEISAISGTGRIRIVPVPVAFEQWALAKGLAGTDAGLAADPDRDGSSNLAEFALGGNPALTSSVPVSFFAVADVYGNGLRLFTYTIQVRNGGAVSYNGNTALLRVDGITYHIEGGVSPVGFNSSVSLSVLRPGPVAPPAGYEYKTFHLVASHSLPRGFMRVWVSVP